MFFWVRSKSVEPLLLPSENFKFVIFKFSFREETFSKESTGSECGAADAVDLLVDLGAVVEAFLAGSRNSERDSEVVFLVNSNQG